MINIRIPHLLSKNARVNWISRRSSTTRLTHVSLSGNLYPLGSVLHLAMASLQWPAISEHQEVMMLVEQLPEQPLAVESKQPLCEH